MEEELICARCGLPITEEDGFYGVDENGQPEHADHFFATFAAMFRANGYVLGGFEDLEEIDRKRLESQDSEAIRE